MNYIYEKVIFIWILPRKPQKILDYFYFTYYNVGVLCIKTSACPSGGIGRRTGLKILRV